MLSKATEYRRDLVLVELGRGGSVVATCYVAVGGLGTKWPLGLVR